MQVQSAGEATRRLPSWPSWLVSVRSMSTQARRYQRVACRSWGALSTASATRRDRCQRCRTTTTGSSCQD